MLMWTTGRRVRTVRAVTATVVSGLDHVTILPCAAWPWPARQTLLFFRLTIIFGSAAQRSVVLVHGSTVSLT